MNRTVKDGTVKAYYYGSRQEFAAHPKPLLTAHDFAEHLERLRQ
jgi:hypothetical protein